MAGSGKATGSRDPASRCNSATPHEIHVKPLAGVWRFPRGRFISRNPKDSRNRMVTIRVAE